MRMPCIVQQVTDFTEADEPSVLYVVRDSVAIITLNRPRSLNAVDADMSIAVGAAMEAASGDSSVRVVVLTGAGRAFCVGGDLKEIAAGRPIDHPEHPEWGLAGFVRNWTPKPTIAAVNGMALGGGAEMMLACDLAVIDERAKIGLPEVKMGAFAAAGGVIRLPRQLPLKIAMEIVLVGDPLSAKRALGLGLVNRVAPAGTALESALDLAATIAANSPIAVQESKRVVHESSAAGSVWGEEPWVVSDSAMQAVFRSRDAKEGAKAFAEKRAPVWEGE